MSARILDLQAGGSRLARFCTAAFSWARRGPVAIPKPRHDVYALLPALADRITRIEALADPGRIRVDEATAAFVPTGCIWCFPDRPRITSIRVWGAPHDGDQFAFIRKADTCLPCALGTPAMPGRGERIGAIRQALIEAAPGAVVRVEVCE